MCVRAGKKGRMKWYAAGLAFECQQCGACCQGPEPGYIWVSKKEIELIAEYLQMPVEQFHRKYLRRVGLRTSIIEHDTTKDCIFLQPKQTSSSAQETAEKHVVKSAPEESDMSESGSATKNTTEKGCVIYPVRPAQCRNWPFWTENLASETDWNLTAQKCPGINRGKSYTYQQIEEIRKRKKWWLKEKDST